MKTLLILLMLAATIHAADIPGLMPVDVYVNCEKNGFETDKSLGGATLSWTCSRDGQATGQVVIARSQTASKVNSVEASALFTGADPERVNLETTEFLAWVATLPYTNADPAKASKWVRDNIAAGGTTTINGVVFKIEVMKGSRTLHMHAST